MALTGIQAEYGCDARLAGPSVSLLLADKTDRAEHGQSR